MYEFSVMKNVVKSFLNSWKWILIWFHWWICGSWWNWIHHWINDAEFYSEINTEFRYEMILASGSNAGFSEGNSLIVQKWHCPLNCRPPTASPISPKPSSKRRHIQCYPPPLLPLRFEPEPSEESPGAISSSCAARIAGTPSRPASSTDPDSSLSLHWRGHLRNLWQIDRTSKRAGTWGRQ